MRRERPATFAPASTAWCAIASPMPALAPVTRIRRPLKLNPSATSFLLFEARLEALHVLGRPARDQDPAAKAADALAVLVVGARLDQDRASVGARARLLDLEHGRLGVDRVAVEGRVLVL